MAKFGPIKKPGTDLKSWKYEDTGKNDENRVTNAKKDKKEKKTHLK